VIAVGVVALVGIALARGPAQLDPSTAEGTVQEYLQAISDQRWEDAYAVLDEQRFADCGPEDIANVNPGPFSATLGQSDDSGVEIPIAPGGGFDNGIPGTTTPPDDTALVQVTLRFGEGGVFGSGWEQWETFSLVSRDGFWWISEDPWPYFRWSCSP
jgi:hypothetical protein